MWCRLNVKVNGNFEEILSKIIVMFDKMYIFAFEIRYDYVD